MSDPNDSQYIEDSGWDDLIFKQDADPEDFTDQAYRRFLLNGVIQTTEELIPWIKKKIK